MELSPERLPAQLDREPLRPAYLIAGPEPLRVLEAADAVRAAARAQGVAEREVFEPEGRDIDWSAVEATFRAPSLFASRRLVEIRLPTTKPGKDGAAVISGFCADPPSDVTLLVTGGEWSRQHGGKWSEAITGIGHLVVAWQIKPHELEGWIEARLRSRNVLADRAAVQQLAERVDGNLLAAAQEVDKLALLADGSTLDGPRMQALMGMVVMELARAAQLAQVQARGGNMANEFKAQRIWDARQAGYRRALQRHPEARWVRFVAEAGRVDRIAKGRGRWGQDPVDGWLALERLLVAVADARAGALLAA